MHSGIAAVAQQYIGLNGEPFSYIYMVILAEHELVPQQGSVGLELYVEPFGHEQCLKSESDSYSLFLVAEYKVGCERVVEYVSEECCVEGLFLLCRVYSRAS